MGVVHINAEFPSGSSPSWEEYKVDKKNLRTAIGIYSVLLLLLLCVCSRFYQHSLENLDKKLDPECDKPGVRYGSELGLSGVLLRDNSIMCL